MPASTAGAGDADPHDDAVPTPRSTRGVRGVRGAGPVVAVVVAAAVVAAVHGGAALLAGTSPSPLAVLLAAGAFLAVLAAARACGLGLPGATAAALLAAASPAAVAACAAPGTAAAALVGVPAFAAAAHHLLRRPATAPSVLALGPLVTAVPLLGGWGADAAAWQPGLAAARGAAALDAVLPLLAVVAAVALLVTARPSRLRWLGAAALLAPALVLLLGLPVAAVVPVVVVGATAVAAAGSALAGALATVATGCGAEGRRGAGRSRHSRHGLAPERTRRPTPRPALAGAAVALAALVVLAPTWGSGVVRASASGDPTTAAARWLAEQVGTDGEVAVDGALYDEVAATSGLASRLVLVGSGDDARWLVAGPELRAGATAGSWAAQALTDSHAVAVFGEGTSRVEVREVDRAAASPSPAPSPSASPSASPSSPSSLSSPSSPSTAPTPTVTSRAPRATATPASEASLEQLLQNPRLDFSPPARTALTDHAVDLRLAALLVQLAAVTPLSVSEVPTPPGSAEGAEPLRTVVLDGLGGEPVGADPEALQGLLRQLSAQDPAYRAEATQIQDGTTEFLRLVLPPAGT